jgi:DNA-directed RNA polymerase beta subunit|nr:RNA polymerase beta subunit protein b [Protosiphon botryoides]
MKTYENISYPYFKKEEYLLETFKRSNQDTCLTHKPAVVEGTWVQSGDLLTDCASSVGGELSLGQNLLIAYMPWEGYNFEDAILISERLVMDDLYTSVHIERYELQTQKTKLGAEEITRNIPDASEKELAHLDSFGVVKLGSWVEEGDILVGKITPINKKKISPYQKLLYTILEKQVQPIKDSSLRAPKGIKAKVIDIKYFLKPSFSFTTIKKENKNSIFKKQTDTSTSKKLSQSSPSPLLRNQREGAPAEAKININKVGGERTIKKKKVGKSVKTKDEQFFKKINLMFVKNKQTNKGFNTRYTLLRYLWLKSIAKKKTYSFRTFKTQNLDFDFLLRTSLFKSRLQYNFNSFNPNGSGLGLGHSTKSPLLSFAPTKSEGLKTAEAKMQKQKFGFFVENRKGKRSSFAKEKAMSLKGRVKKLALSEFEVKQRKKSLILKNIETIHIYLAEKRKIQVGDKMAGRHGNKGIVSQILPIQDMPYLPDGTPIDMVLNPLGVPSRMNVGQIYECLLGLAGRFLGENYKVSAFDEIYGSEASRSFVFNKLYEARTKTGFKWLFDPNSPGKIRLFDGRNGECFDQKVTVGQAYILRLVHMVDDKIHSRSTGPYSLVTQQPLRGRSKQGGQRLGEMEVWALEGYGAAFTLLEMLTIKSDDMTGRMTLWSNLILNKDISIGTPESFKVLVCELQALCLDIGLFRNIESNNPNSNLREINSLMNLP